MSKAANERKRQAKQQWQHWKVSEPIDTVEQAVDFLIARLDSDSMEDLKSVPEEEMSGYAHRGLGMFIRNEFGLWKNNVNLLRSCGDENMFPDNASGVIIEALIRRLKSN